MPTNPTTSEAVDVAALFEAHATWLVRVAQRLTGSSQAAEDVVQEVFVVAHRRQSELRPGENVRSWLYRVAVNRCRQHHRGSGRYTRAMERLYVEPKRAIPDPEANEARQQRSARIRQTITELTPLQREVFVLFELEGLSGQEIAEVLDVSLGTVWSRLRLGRRRFRAAWIALGEEP